MSNYYGDPDYTFIGPLRYRQEPYLQAKVHLPYVVAKGGAFVHRTAGWGWVAWRIPRNYTQPWTDRLFTEGPAYPSELHVKTLCRFPSWVKAFRLITQDQVLKILCDDSHWVLCPHCAKLMRERQDGHAPS